MIRKATAVTARQTFGDLLNQVQYRNDSVLITKDGKPVAALVDVQLFDRIRALQEDFRRLADTLGTSYAGVPGEVAESEISTAVSAVRRKAKASKTR